MRGEHWHLLASLQAGKSDKCIMLIPHTTPPAPHLHVLLQMTSVRPCIDTGSLPSVMHHRTRTTGCSFLKTCQPDLQQQLTNSIFQKSESKIRLLSLVFCLGFFLGGWLA